jgi:hypothetical protein
MTARLVAVSVAVLLGSAAVPSAQPQSRGDELPPRISRLERWLSAIPSHRPGAFDDHVRLINTWTQEELRLIWVDVSTVVSLIREPGVSTFFVSEPRSAQGPTEYGFAFGGRGARQVNPLVIARATQVLYTAPELRGLRAIANRISPDGKPGPANDVVKRGAMLHADIEILAPPARRPPADPDRPGPGGSTLWMDDGQRLGLFRRVSHWNMGRRLLDLVRPLDSTTTLKTSPDPGSDETVRRWYVASSAVMIRMRRIESSHFNRALELFPNDPEVLFFNASVHEVFAGVRMQSVMRSMKGQRAVTFDVDSEGAELWRAERLYQRTLERNPTFSEASIRLGRVLGLRGGHAEAVEQLKQGLSAVEPVLQYYANLFLGRELEALGNVEEARRSYERAAALAPTAQSPWLGLSRVADQAGDRAAASDAIARVLKLPVRGEDRADPWWVYEIVQARGVDGRLADLRQRIAALPE